MYFCTIPTKRPLIDVGLSLFQRALNDLQRTRLSLHRMDLAPLPPPCPSSPASKLERRHTWRLRKRDYLLTGKGDHATYMNKYSISVIYCTYIHTQKGQD